jgi:hypothetical protein
MSEASRMPKGREQRAKEQDLRATEDSVRADAAELAKVEDTKAKLDPGDPKVDRLSAEAVDLADQLARKTRAQRDLAGDLH